LHALTINNEPRELTSKNISLLSKKVGQLRPFLIPLFIVLVGGPRVGGFNLRIIIHFQGHALSLQNLNLIGHRRGIKSRY
jgi:hypothetical protein